MADALHGEFAKYFNAGDIEGLLSLCEPDASADGKPLSMSGKTSEVLRRQPDGRWLYIIDHPADAQD